MLLPSTVRSLVIALCLLVGATAFAGELDALKDTTPEQRAKAQTAMMKEKLGLTDEQVAKIGALNLKYAEQMDPIIKGTEGQFMKARDVRNVEEQKEAELKGLLSPDQFQKFQAMKEEMREHLMDQIHKQAGS
jgi:uncharacterized protein YpuA (DUF1002 family)